MCVCICLKVSVNYGQPVGVSVLFHKIEWVNMVLGILNLEKSMLSVKGQNMASVNMVKDVTKFIFQISVRKMTHVKKSIVTKDPQ